MYSKNISSKNSLLEPSSINSSEIHLVTIKLRKCHILYAYQCNANEQQNIIYPKKQARTREPKMSMGLYSNIKYYTISKCRAQQCCWFRGCRLLLYEICFHFTHQAVTRIPQYLHTFIIMFPLFREKIPTRGLEVWL